MRVRYESFGGIISLNKPASTIYVDQTFMQQLGYSDSGLWDNASSFLSAPITVHFAITYRCPMGCRTCYNASGKTLPNELTTEQAKRVLDVLAKMQVFTVAFGGGEPLARPDLFELAHYAREQGILPTLTTNGFYIDHEAARRCKVFGHVHVSLDGVDETYQAVRGIDGFEHAARAVRLLRRNRISVGVNCVVCRANFDQLEELVRFLGDYGVRDVIFLRLKPGGRAKSLYKTLTLTPEQAFALYPRLEEITRRYRIHSHVDCAMLPFIYCHHPDEKSLRLFAGEGCIGANEIIEVLPNGEVRGCSFSTTTVGKAHHLPRFWHKNPLFERFRVWTQCPPEPCKSCKYLTLCHGGCHAIAEALTGDFNAPDPECPFVLTRRK